MLFRQLAYQASGSRTLSSLGHPRTRARGEQHVQPGESLKRLVVELTSPARALRLGGLKAPARGLLAGVLERCLHALALALV
jgi:hypothetical protein